MKTRSIAFAAIFLSGLVSTQALAQVPGHDNPPISYQTGDWDFIFDGFIQTGGIVIMPDYVPEKAEDATMGFLNFNARANFDVVYKDFVTARIGLDGAGGMNAVKKTFDGAFNVKDAYLDFNIVPAFRIKAGQFKPPYDFESLTSEPKLNFIQRSLVSLGGRSLMYHEKDYTFGISPGRQLGVNLYSDMLDFGYVGFKYQLAVTSGSMSAKTTEPEGRLSVFGRLEFALMNLIYDDISPGYFLSLAVSGHYDFLDDPKDVDMGGDWGLGDGERAGVAAELHAKYKTFDLDFEFVWQTIDTQMILPDDPLEASRNDANRLATVAQASYMLPIEYWRLQLAYRFAWFKTDNERAYDYPAMQHTVSLAYFVENYPIVIRADYTHNDIDIKGVKEEDDNDNNTVALMVQFDW